MKTDHHEHIIAALSGLSFGGFVTGALGDPFVHQIIAGIISMVMSVIGVAFMAWFKARFSKRFPAAVTAAAEVEQALTPLIDQYGHEVISRVLTRAALTASVRPEALAPMTGKYPALRVPTDPKVVP